MSKFNAALIFGVVLMMSGSVWQLVTTGSTLISRTHPKRPILWSEACHGEQKEVFRRIQARSGTAGDRAWGDQEPGGSGTGHQREYAGPVVSRLFANGAAAYPGQGKPRDEELASLKRELARVRKERDFLKEAAAFFARESK